MIIFTVPILPEGEINTLCENCTIVSEGKAKMIFPFKSTVFFNPVQEFNRDISVCVIKAFQKYKNLLEVQQNHSGKKLIKQSKRRHEALSGEDDTETNIQSDFESKLMINDKPDGKIVILEALAATGIRSIRYSLEIDSVYKVIANDMQPHSVKTIVLNAIKNGVYDKIVPTKMEATNLLNLIRHPINYRPDVIDIDPYGSAAIFIDSAVQSISEGGLLCITCTDMATLCGNTPEVAYSKYGAIPIKSPFCHEMALRILLHAIESTANRYKRYIIPLLSISVDFYIRVFLQVFTSPNEVKKSFLKKSYVNVCSKCSTFQLYSIGREKRPNVYQAAPAPIGLQICQICKGSTRVGGPIWSHPIQNSQFLNTCIEEIENNPTLYGTSRRITGLLHVVSEELHDCPLYYVVDTIFSFIGSSVPPSLEFRSAIVHSGYRVSLSHCKKNSIKTDAPATVIWDIVKAWVPKAGDISSSQATKMAAKIDFTPIPSQIPESVKNRLTRFQMNPLPNWGPMKRGKIAKLDETKKKMAKSP
uniref:tRNA (guanine(26)-N(2))-dimethyltransferase n=1 Tax=Myxobolus squamalis TaxID=59785 RepID=A0A6B2G4P5_MYXSQ